MKELLGAWDDEHSCGSAQNANKNVNNNCAGALDLTLCDEVDGGRMEVVNYSQVTGKSSWGAGPFRKLFSSFSFLGRKT